VTTFIHQPPFGIDVIKKIIPHRYPFLLVDGITELGDDYIRGYKNLSANEHVFEGHFPGEPIYPGVLQIESMAQAGACWILNRPGYEGQIAYLMTVDHVKLRRPARPGDRLDLYGQITNLKKRTGRLVSKIHVGDTLISEMEIVFALGNNNNGGGHSGERMGGERMASERLGTG
jgi:3-hydroxyacyl-[acyl-carrier-protein] dehydratase